MPKEVTELGLYTDQEVIDGVQELFGYKAFTKGMQNFLPEDLSALILKNKEDIQSSFDFQKKLIHPLLSFVIKASIDTLDASGLASIKKEDSHLFISNHRDIGLDSAFLNLMFFEKGFKTSQIAIGDNLMKHRIAELIFRINKSFAVKRSGSPRELYQSSIDLSKYIHKIISSNSDSIWIAQREGRAKDGNDETQIGLLKMLSLSKNENVIDHFHALNIIPVAMSYEYDPCDFLKTKEYIDKLNNPDYQKSFEDDMHAILQGIKGKKGKVQVSFGHSINQELEKLPSDIRLKDFLKTLVEIIDNQIHRAYKMNPINYIAMDILNDSDSLMKNYTQEELNATSAYFNLRIEKFPLKDRLLAKKYLLGIYANPLKNQLSATA